MSALPPFARQIDPQGMVTIYCGRRAWDLATPGPERPASLVFPRGRDPAEFRWPVEGRQVLILAGDAPDLEVDLLVVELLRAGADMVHARYSDARLVDYYAPGRGQS